VWTIGEMSKEEAEAMSQGVDMEASQDRWWDQVRLNRQSHAGLWITVN
jgi:hypothetical protein